VSLRTARGLTAAYFTAALVAVTWPGLLPFARIRPFVLGLPFSMAWIAAWIAGSVVVLYLLDRVERGHRGPDDTSAASEPPPAGSHPAGSHPAGSHPAGSHPAGSRPDGSAGRAG
jgi:hypothetical protein